MDKRFLSILAGIVVIFAGIFVISQHSSNSNGSSSVSNATKHIEGKGEKGVTLVEYGDYQCPVCALYYQPLKQVTSQLNNDIYFQFRNLPLTAIHKNAFAAARAAEAAGMQGKYWEMHDMLYENQSESSGWAASNNPLDSYFVVFAKQIGLDVNKFKQDYASSQVNNAINADLAAFGETGKPQATPTFFLDGKYVDNGQLSDPSTGGPSVDKINAVIKAEIAKQNQ